MEEKLETLFSHVVIIGAGFSGINMACQLQRKFRTTDYIIYERESGFGGAWFANKCKSSFLACDAATKKMR